MAQSKCPSCEGTRFEIKIQENVRGTDLKWPVFQCAGCGAVLGVADFYSNSAVIQRLKAIEKKLGRR